MVESEGFHRIGYVLYIFLAFFGAVIGEAMVRWFKLPVVYGKYLAIVGFLVIIIFLYFGIGVNTGGAFKISDLLPIVTGIPLGIWFAGLNKK